VNLVEGSHQASGRLADLMPNIVTATEAGPP
jgi:hypothetical protein